MAIERSAKVSRARRYGPILDWLSSYRASKDHGIPIVVDRSLSRTAAGDNAGRRSQMTGAVDAGRAEIASSDAEHGAEGAGESHREGSS